MVSQIELGDTTVDVVLKDIKNVHLSVYPPTGKVRISAPKRMSMETIRVFAISKLDWIKLYESRTRKDWWVGHCRFPNPAKGYQYQITAAFPVWWTYPKKMKIPTGSKTHAGSWRYTHTAIEMRDRDEAMLAVFGHELFHYLKRTRQLSTEEFGRNGNPAANRFAIHLIEDFRDT